MLDDALSFTNVGTWNSTLNEEYLTFAPIAGKVLRYRFTPIALGTKVSEVAFSSAVPTAQLRTSMTTTTSATDSIIIPGSPANTYVVELFVRGSFELNTYKDGVQKGYTYAYGSPVNASNTMQVLLTVSNPWLIEKGQFYLNAGTVGSYSVPVAYRLRMLVVGGCTLTLSMSKPDASVIYPLDQGGGKPLLQDITAVANGEVCQVDLINTLTADVTFNKNGNVRNFLWSAFEDYIAGYGATK